MTDKKPTFIVKDGSRVVYVDPEDKIIKGFEVGAEPVERLGVVFSSQTEFLFQPRKVQ